MFMDRGLLDASGLDGLSYEDFFSNRKSLEDGVSKLPPVMETSNLHGADLQPSQLFFVQDDNHGSHADNTWLSPASVSGSSSVENPSSRSTSRDGDSSEDNEIFSDIIFGYISRMLMEEDVDEKINLLDLEKTVLQAAEKPFYDILGQQYPSPAPEQPLLREDHFLDRPVESINSYNGLSDENSSNRIVELSWFQDSSSNLQLAGDPFSVGTSSQYTSSSFGGLGSEYGSLVFPDLSSESQPALQFKRGMEEAQKFLPSEDQLAVGLDLDTFALQHESDTKEHEAKKRRFNLNSLSWGRKKPQTEENLDLKEGKSLKLSAAYSDEALRSEMFDAVLLCQGVNKENGLHDPNQNGAHKGSQNGNTKSSIHGGKAQRKRQQKKDAVDLSSLLIYCAQAVAADDRQMANELLKQIRQNSSPFGDGNQRLAHCFADGLEARLAGTGSLIYNSLVAKRTTAADILKGYQLYITACPFLRISHSFSNHTILHVAENASRVHIVDFGIYFGFQWPCLIHRMSMRPGGPQAPNHRHRLSSAGLPPCGTHRRDGQKAGGLCQEFQCPIRIQRHRIQMGGHPGRRLEDR
ncbi:hypothetical protein HPP92_006363 [Vanilla planifolia]|uniref:Scarecrow-like protein 9 n=1 Tax=Vanilla planifolia TaxID=51239 RepID=A0A835RC07_VANPL|nr:hypothetical protein HPP92_006363 [Vanilla planifolia]